MSERSYRVVALAGEGVEFEMTQASLMILKALAAAEAFSVDVDYGTVEESARQDSQAVLPAPTLQLCEQSNGVLFGAIAREGLQELRQYFDLFVNLRSVQPSPSLLPAAPIKLDQMQGVELLFVRELTSGVPADAPDRGVDNKGTYGLQTIRYDDVNIRRTARIALEFAQSRRQRLAVAYKGGVLPYLPWTRLIQIEALAFPAVTVETIPVDQLAVQLAVRPQDFDVVLTCNLFGNILSNLTGAIAGATGLLGSASLNSDRFGLYEAVYSAGRDSDHTVAHPLGTLSSIALMLEQWGEGRAAQRLTALREAFLTEGYRTADLCCGEPDPPRKVVSLEELVALFTQALEASA